MPQATPPSEPLSIDKMVAGGEGFAHLPDGRPLFVPGAVKGDLIRVLELADHRSYARAARWELTTPSPERRVAPCRYAASCGGCDWMMLNDEAQRTGKLQILKEALRRTARLDELPVRIEAQEVAAPLGYRTRVRLHLDPELGPGFHSAQSHRVIAIEQCLVATPRVNQALTELRAAWESEPGILSNYSEVEVRALGPKTELCFTIRRGEPSSRAHRSKQSSALRQLFAPKGLVVDVRGTPDAQPVAPLATLLQAASLTEQIQLHIAPSAFTQVNWPVNQAIVAELLEGVDKRELHTFADLYSGIGNFSLPLLARGLTGVGVEESPLSVALARLAASKHGFTLGHFIAEDVANTVRSWAQEARRFDLVVVDPPRSGATQTTAAIAAIAQRYLFLCACDPVTFARDIRDYLAAGFQLESLRIHDMFPQTHHFEVTAWLRR